MIFMKALPRSSRVTGPKIRVPIGSFVLLINTAAFRSNRIEVPSARRISFAVRTTTARCTSPFFTRPRGIASLTETTMISPTEAYLRFEPPSTLMHWTFRYRRHPIWSLVGSCSNSIPGPDNRVSHNLVKSKTVKRFYAPTTPITFQLLRFDSGLHSSIITS